MTNSRQSHSTYHDLVFIFYILQSNFPDFLLFFHFIGQPMAEDFKHEC